MPSMVAISSASTKPAHAETLKNALPVVLVQVKLEDLHVLSSSDTPRFSVFTYAIFVFFIVFLVQQL